MALDKEALKDAIEEKATKSPKQIKNIANEMVREGRLAFWSSGSTTMYGIPSRIQNEEKSE